VICPTCHSPDNAVLRTTEKDGFVNRQRQCKTCAHRWRTVEADEQTIERARAIIEIGRQLQELATEG
jgi:transcriptional regulator NrdR family protein